MQNAPLLQKPKPAQASIPRVLRWSALIAGGLLGSWILVYTVLQTVWLNETNQRVSTINTNVKSLKAEADATVASLSTNNLKIQDVLSGVSGVQNALTPATVDIGGTKLNVQAIRTLLEGAVTLALSRQDRRTDVLMANMELLISDSLAGLLGITDAQAQAVVNDILAADTTLLTGVTENIDVVVLVADAYVQFANAISSGTALTTALANLANALDATTVLRALYLVDMSPAIIGYLRSNAISTAAQLVDICATSTCSAQVSATGYDNFVSVPLANVPDSAVALISAAIRGNGFAIQKVSEVTPAAQSLSAFRALSTPSELGMAFAHATFVGAAVPVPGNNDQYGGYGYGYGY